MKLALINSLTITIVFAFSTVTPGIGQQGNFSNGKEKNKPTIILEGMCDYNLWFWNCHPYKVEEIANNRIIICIVRLT